MRDLTKNWLTDGLIDFEYKKYIMLSYLQYAQSKFSDKMLYPIYEDLRIHYKYLLDYKNEKQAIDSSFPKRISKIDIIRREILYEKIATNNNSFSELEEIVEYGLKLFNEKIKVGQQLFDQIEEAISVEPIGVLPLYKNEGYIMISTDKSKKVRIYKYFFSFVKGLKTDEQIRMMLVDLKQKTIVNTAERIKREITKYDKNLPNPATYLVHCEVDYPLMESILPISKRLLTKKLAA